MECRRDNGTDIVKVLQSIEAVYPGQFSAKKVSVVRHGRGRPMNVFEITMDESLRDELAADDQESIALPGDELYELLGISIALPV